jgi:hypothetical protein
MGVLLVWLILWVSAAVAGTCWARRLWTRRKELSLGTRVAAALLAGTTLTAAVGTVVGLAKAFSAVDGETLNPADNARVVAEGISGAMNFTALGIASALLGAVILSLMMRKRGGRSG